MALAYDTMISGSASSGGGATQDLSLTVANVADRTLVILVASQVAVGDVATGISGVSGVSWTKLNTAAGNGTMRGEIWYATGTVPTGAITATIQWAATTTGAQGAFMYSYNGAHQTTPVNGFVAATTGNHVITVASGDGAISSQVDDNNSRTVTGCTSSTDVSAYGAYGTSSAHCTGTPTSTFTWSGFGGTSIAVGCSVLQAAAAAGGGPLTNGGSITHGSLIRGGRIAG